MEMSGKGDRSNEVHVSIAYIVRLDILICLPIGSKYVFLEPITPGPAPCVVRDPSVHPVIIR